MSLDKNNILKNIINDGYGWDEKNVQERDDFYKKYGNIFQLENIDSLTPEIYREFWKDGIFHWGDGIPQSTGNLIKEFPWETIQKNLKILVDESKSLSERIKNFQNTSTGGKYIKHSTYTVILHMINPQKYAIINKLSLFALDELKLSSKKERKPDDWIWVPKLENTILKLCTELNTDTWKIDWIWARLKEHQSVEWWLISAGKDAERDNVWNEFKNSNTVGFYWNETGDLSKLTDKQIKEKFKQIGIKKDGKPKDWGPARDIKKVKKNDILFVKLGKRGFYGIGKATGTYQYNTNQSYHHTIPVQWITTQPYEYVGDSPKLQLNNTMTIIPDKNQEPELVKYYENAINGETLTFEEENQNMEKYSEYLDILNWEKNLILYGPPGTGKTYHATKIAKSLTSNQGSKIAICWPTSTKLSTSETESKIEDFAKNIEEDGKVLWGVDWSVLKQVNPSDYPIVGYIYHRHNIVAIVKISNCTSHEDTNDSDLKLRQEKWHQGQDNKRYLHFTDIQRCKPFSHKKLEMYDPSKKMPDFIQQQVYVNQATNFIKKVTFHQSYSYEEFMEGIKAKIEKEDETSETSKRFVDYAVEPGIFKSFCESAEKDLENSYVMIIDEINRGNISKIFGELITIIEKDKRNDPVTLPYSRKSFSVPDNVYIIGTMNTADRSIALLDTALKRRFGHTEIMPDSSILKDKNDKPSIVDSINLQELLDSLNKKIREIGMRERQIGHSYLMNGEYGIDKIKDLRLAFVYDILPLLRDFSLGDDEELKRIISEFFIDWDTKNVKDELKKGGNDGNESFKAEIKSFLKWADSESSDTQNGE